MRLYLAATFSPIPTEKRNLLIKETKPLYILETFYAGTKYCNQALSDVGVDNFLLDSGAFTFMNSHKNVSLNELQTYIEAYIAYINENNIKYFFELDIDVIVGYKKVKEIRDYIEQKTGKRSIPVWHLNRGLEDYIETCKKYNYIAIGGLAFKEIQRKDWHKLNKFIKIAHNYNTKVHGLGFTPIDLHKYNFDTVDSTSWKMLAIRGGKLAQFNGKAITTRTIDKHGKKLDIPTMAMYNFKEWVKYQYYLNRQKVRM